MISARALQREALKQDPDPKPKQDPLSDPNPDQDPEPGRASPLSGPISASRHAKTLANRPTVAVAVSTRNLPLARLALKENSAATALRPERTQTSTAVHLARKLDHAAKPRGAEPIDPRVTAGAVIARAAIGAQDSVPIAPIPGTIARAIARLVAQQRGASAAPPRV